MPRLPLLLLSLFVVAFSIYGFLASFEPVENAMIFRVAYALAGLLGLAGLVKILRRPRQVRPS